MGGGGGWLTWNHFDFTSISLWPPLKPSQITMKTEGPGPTAPGDQRHRGNQRDPQSPSKNKRKLTTIHQDPCRLHQGCSIISQNNFSFDFAGQSQAPSPKGTDPPERWTTNDNKKPSDRITHAGTIQISRLSKPPNLRFIDGYPSMNSLIFIGGYPAMNSMIFIDGYPSMNINGYPVL